MYPNANEAYHSYLKKILTDEQAVIKSSRAGMTIGTAGEIMKFDLSQGAPFINTKRVYTRGVLQELVWFLRGPAPDGEMHIDYLVKNDCNFWTGNLFDFYNMKRGFKEAKYSDKWNEEYAKFEESLKTDEKFLALHGSLGRPYSAQWRTWRTSQFNSELEKHDYVKEHVDWWDQPDKEIREYRMDKIVEHAKLKTIDQLSKALDEIRVHSDSRRIIVESWRPDEIPNMALPPCHKTMQFVVMGDRLDITMQQRSCDSFLGVPFNIASYGALGIWAAAVAGLKPGIFTHHLVDTHIYCGDAEQGNWYKENLAFFQENVRSAKHAEDYQSIIKWIEEQSPKGKLPGKENRDHVTGVLTQLSQDTQKHPIPTLEITVDKAKSSAELLNTVSFEDFKLVGYDEKAYKYIPRKMPV
jgi:thymidylate synthase